MNKIIRKIFRWLGILILSLITLLIIVILLIRLPAVQLKIVNYATNYVSEKTGTRVEIDRLYIGFNGNLQLEGLFLDTPESDTLISLKYLEVGVSVKTLFTSEIHLSNINIDGLIARIKVNDSGVANYQFLIDAFVSDEEDEIEIIVEKEDGTKDSKSIKLDKLSFCNSNISYEDEFSCMFIQADLGCIKINPRELDFNNMNLQLGKIDITDLNAGIRTCAGAQIDTTTSEPLNLMLGWDDFNIRKLNVEYVDEVADQKFFVDLPELSSNDFHLDFGKQMIRLDNFKIVDLNANLFLASVEEAKEVDEKNTDFSASGVEEFSIGWDIELNKFELLNTNINYSTDQNTPKVGKFDASHIIASKLNIVFRDLRVKDDEVTVQVNDISFEERSGFQLSEFSTSILFSKEKVKLSSLSFLTPNSEAAGNFSLSYPNINDLLGNPTESKININMPSVKLDWKDASYFTEEQIPHDLTKSPLLLAIDIDGTLADLNIKDLKFRQANNFVGRLRGRVQNPLDTDLLMLDIVLSDTRIYTKLIRQFASSTEESVNWAEMPAYMDLNADFKGSLEEFKSKINMQSGRGNLNALVELNASEKYKGNLVVQNLEAGAIAGISDLGQVSLRLGFTGQYFDLKKAKVDLNLIIDSVEYNNYSYEDIRSEVTLDKEIANILLISNDPILDFTLTGQSEVKEVITGNINLDIRNIEPRALNFIEENYIINGNISAAFEIQDSSEMAVELNLEHFHFFVDSERYALENSRFTYSQTLKTLNFTGRTEFLEMDLESNLNQFQTIDLIKRQIGNYVGAMELETPDSILNTGFLKLNLSLNPNDIITEVFLPDIEEIQPLYLSMELSGSDNTIGFTMRSKQLIYSGMQFDSIYLDAQGNGNNLTYDFHLEKFLVSDFTFYEPTLTGSFEGNKLISTFSIKDEDLKLSNSIAFEIIPQDSLTIFNLIHDELFINYEYWTIDENNKIIIGPQFLEAENFTIFYNQTKIDIQTGHEGRNNNLRLLIEEIDLGRLANGVLDDSIGLEGRFNAAVFLDNIYESPEFEIESKIENLKYDSYNFGDFTLSVQPAKASDAYTTNINLNGASQLRIFGELILGEIVSFTQEVNLNKVDMEMIEKFSGGAIKDSKGALTGKFNMIGNIDDYSLTGHLDFKGIEFVPTDLGKSFSLKDERISLTSRGIEFKQFTIRDFENNSAILNGEILTTDYNDIKFDLSLNAKNFKALDLEAARDLPYHGQLVFSAETTIKGDLNLPVVRGRLKIEEATNLTVVVPEQSADLIDRENVVIFVDETSLRLRAAEERGTAIRTVSTYKGLDLIAVLETDPNANFRIIIDPIAGDYLDIQGTSNLNLTINQAGDMSLTGRYDIKSGAYQISMYDVVRRRFEISENSYIMWQGDPMKAEMDITAVYTVRTDALDLLADQLVGADESKRTMYRQEIPYLVNMQIKGSIEAPEISFFLDLPDAQKGIHGGVVYSRLQQLNQQESEVNKQAFALIVLGRFLSDAPSAASGGGEALARNSASRLLTQQLNNLAGKYIQGIDINFNLDSYSDYSGGTEQGRTQLNVEVKKTLFSDRLILQVGSNIDLEGEDQSPNRGSSELVGDLIAEYLVSADGRYRLKAFRKNEFEGMIDGQLINSGISFVFIRETEGQGVRRKRKALEAIKKEDDAENTND